MRRMSIGMGPRREFCKWRRTSSHGVGLVDEYPSIAYVEDYPAWGYDGVFAENMVVRGSGGILNVAGLAGVMPGPHMAVYCATKAYVLSFSAALANELRGTGVTVTCLSPGPTETRFGETAGFSALQLFRLSAPMSSITVAEAAIAALARGADLEVPGWRNRLLAASVRLVSTRMAAGIARHMLESPRAAAKKVAVSE